MEQLLKQLFDWATNIKNQTQIEGNSSTIVGNGLERLISAITNLQANKADITALAQLNKELQNISIKFKGYHSNETDLIAAYPKASNKKDDFAWVGSPYPGTVWKVKANAGEWEKTEEKPKQPEVNLGEYVEKKHITESITDSENTVPSNLAVYGLQSKLYGGEFDGSINSELIPYASDTNLNLISATSCCYELQTAYVGKRIGYLRVKIGVAGTFTVYSSTERNNISTARWKKTFTTVLGENNLTIGETVNQGEFLCFASSTDSSRFSFNDKRKNAIGGGLYYGTLFYGQDLCIGIYSGYSIEDIDGDIPKLWAKIEEIEHGSGLGGDPIEKVIPYDGTGTQKPTSKGHWIRYNNQSLFQGKKRNKIAVNVEAAGKFKIFSGSTDGIVKSWEIFADVVAGKNEIKIAKDLPSDEYLYFGGIGHTANYLFKTSVDDTVGGGFTYQSAGSYNQKLCIGIWIDGSGTGGGENPNPEPVLTEIEKWRKMEMDICKYYAIPCIDITYNNGITAFSMGKLMPDGVHPNTEGHKFLATAIYPIFSGLASIMANGDGYYSLGDSITAGHGGATSYAHYLATAAGLNRINKAVSGNTIIGNDFYNQVASIPVNFTGVVTIMIGVNDYNRKHPRGDAAMVLVKPFDSLDRNASSAEAFRLGLDTLLRKAPFCKPLVIVPFFTTW